MQETQLLKGILEGCVLKLISYKETYGYEIISELDKYGFKDVKDGTLYPVLTRLEKKGYIHCRIGKSPLGPKRKYYSITCDGEIYLQQFQEIYYQITNQANQILK